MIGIIVTGHGNFASGMSSSVELICGKQPDYEAVDFLLDYSTIDLENKLKEAIDRLQDCSGILILADIPGGSPFKTSALLGRDNPKLQVIGGTNLPMLCEVVMARRMDDDMDALIDTALETGKSQIVHFSF